MSGNKACCWILGILAGGFVLTMLIVGWGISRAMSGGFQADLGSKIKVEPNTWLMMRVSGVMPDYNEDPDLGFLGGESGSSLNDMLRALEYAKEDPNISGIILRPMGSNGFASLRELREAILDFKSSGKPVLAHIEVASDRDYYLASVADSIFMMPGRLGGINFGGLAFSSTYLKKTFEKVGLKFHVIHAGAYKGAFEELGRDSMSSELRSNITTLYEDVYGTFVREMAAGRGAISFQAIDEEYKNGKSFLVAGQECLSKHYVDALVDWPVLRKRLQGDSEDFESISPRSYVSTKRMVDIGEEKNQVAVLFAQGEITFDDDNSGFGGSGITAAKLTKQLDDLAEDEDVKAVVMRVNSPGGSALASKQILAAALRLKDKKPLVVSMGRVAASGGYYISLAANKIVAQPTTITGSIGVVSAIPTGEELYNKIGAREETISMGRWANFFRFDKTLGEEQFAVLNSLMDSIYLEFKEDVIAGRELSMSGLDSIAEGQVWTGTQALSRGLVDTLGGVDVAIALAAKEAELGKEEYSIEYYPEKKDIFKFFVEKFATQISDFHLLGESLQSVNDPGKLAKYLKNFYERTEFLQTLVPFSLDI
ncbi:MAG: signal peptide peptidase SppA [Calditrichaeota bacterium]|nr:signal peptide peptidase SppA [Calditrichota bacterium]MCB9368465.1 signal peptide peptidase SppA [Calditrichota bacterium]